MTHKTNAICLALFLVLAGCAQSQLIFDSGENAPVRVEDKHIKFSTRYFLRQSDAACAEPSGVKVGQADLSFYRFEMTGRVRSLQDDVEFASGFIRDERAEQSLTAFSVQRCVQLLGPEGLRNLDWTDRLTFAVGNAKQIDDIFKQALVGKPTSPANSAPPARRLQRHCRASLTIEVSVLRKDRYVSTWNNLVQAPETADDWSNVNTAFACWNGEGTLAFTKDDIGNWNLKKFE